MKRSKGKFYCFSCERGFVRYYNTISCNYIINLFLNQLLMILNMLLIIYSPKTAFFYKFFVCIGLKRDPELEKYTVYTHLSASLEWLSKIEAMRFCAQPNLSDKSPM